MACKELIIVIGPGRSGTSLCASMLQTLGVAMHDDLIAGSKSNPSGFFESKAVVDFDQRILGAKGLVGAAIPVELSADEIETLAVEAANILKRLPADAEIAAIKDPRISILLPVWVAACRKLSIRPRPLLAVRNLGATARSMEEFNVIGRAGAEVAAASRLLTAIEACIALDLQPLVNRYEAVLCDPLAAATLLKTTYDLPGDPAAAAALVNARPGAERAEDVRLNQMQAMFERLLTAVETAPADLAARVAAERALITDYITLLAEQGQHAELAQQLQRQRGIVTPILRKCYWMFRREIAKLKARSGA